MSGGMLSVCNLTYFDHFPDSIPTRMKLFCLFALYALLELSGAYNWQQYEGYKYFTVRPSNKDQIDILRDLQDTTSLDFWDEPNRLGRPVTVMVSPHEVPFLKAILETDNIHYVIEDSDIVDEMALEWDRLVDRDMAAFNYSDFNDYQTTMDELELMASDCPAGFTCETSNIGLSVEGREIRMLTIRNPANTEAFWIDSHIHAREWLSSATTMNIFRKMIDSAGVDPEADLLLTKNWFFVPIDNPDGYHHTWVDDRLWRKNRADNENSTCIGTDLNRNFDFMWGEPGASPLPCSYTYRGPSAASEPETQAMQNQILSVAAEVRAAWSVHTYGQYLLHPFGDCTNPPEPIFSELSRVTTLTCDAIEATWGTLWDCGNTCEVLYATSGTTHDWAYGGANIQYSWTPELRGPGFVVPPTQIEPSVEEIWNGLYTLAREVVPLNP